MFKSALFAAGLSGLAVTSAQLTPQQIAWYRAQLSSDAPQPAPPNIQADPLGDALVRWKALEQSSNYSFNDYASFLVTHRDWPGEKMLQRSAERALARGGWSPSQAVAYFKIYPPVTDDGAVAYAEALQAVGNRDEAVKQARDAWTTRVLSTDAENKLLQDFPGAFRTMDYDKRMDMLLWHGATSAAARIDPYISSLNRPLLDARLALLTSAPDAVQRDAGITSSDRDNPGFMLARATWLLNNRQVAQARAYLAKKHHLSAYPTDTTVWFRLLLDQARGAAADGDYSQAYDIASQVDDAYPQDVNFDDRPYAEKDVYTDLVWLAGQTALTQLRKPRDAAKMFDRYARPFDSPQTRPRGLYWAGRAADQAGEHQTARDYFQRAAQYADAYYGQLSAERIGAALQPPSPIPTDQVDSARRDAFYNRETVRAAQMLGTLGNWSDQTDFLRQIAINASTPADHQLGIELARALNRPDLGVMISRSALQNGLDDYVAAGYPTLPLPSADDTYWTMIHAISRQESQFDRRIVSRAGAVGLMQLMPGTARDMAGKLGVSYSPVSLEDPTYNVQLGINYFQHLFALYGSYPLAIAAYNAGPGNVNKWLAANGDPRDGAVDMVNWIEQIPFHETRTYVQRVLENAVVYDMLNPAHAQSLAPARLDWYLGRKPGGTETQMAAAG
ncbi:MAG: transglycosylase SLT domain-containing protein [Sphingomonas sp.]